MASLSISKVSKSYGSVARVLDGIDLDVRSGELFTLLGPSGCGKTTLLRIVAGFHQQNAGEIRIDGERIDHLPPHRRDIGMVFQDYAVFPHLSVADNVAFGLRARKLPQAETAARVAEILRIVHLQGMEDRLPNALSGGQQQRVGLARAMAIRPKLLLMDEPLSNLDAKLRIELREDIRDIQQRLGITTVYVTHDQEEALAISDRIGLMNGGALEQVGTPFEIYRKPATRFVAGFIGSMNIVPAEIDRQGRVQVLGQALPIEAKAPPGPVELGIRPESVVLGPPEPARASMVVLDGRVRRSAFLGREAQHVVASPVGDLLAKVADPTLDLLSDSGRPIQVGLPYFKLLAFGGDGRAVVLTVLP